MFLCLWHVYKAWAENAVKKIVSAEKRSRVLSTLGSIMYSRDCPLHAEPVLCIVVTYEIRVFFKGAQKQVFSSILKFENVNT